MQRHHLPSRNGGGGTEAGFKARTRGRRSLGALASRPGRADAVAWGRWPQGRGGLGAGRRPLPRVPGACLPGSGAEIPPTLSPAPPKPEFHPEPSSRGQEEPEPPLGLSLFSDKQPFHQDLLGF